MDFIFPILVLAFVATAVALGVRIINRRERWAKHTAVGMAIMLLLGYPLSFGPACWIATRRDDMSSFIGAVYLPVAGALIEIPECLHGAVEWYLGLGAPDDSRPHFWRHGGKYGLGWDRPAYSYTAASR